MSSSISDTDFQSLQLQITEAGALLRTSFPIATPEQCVILQDCLSDIQATVKLYQIMFSFRESIQKFVKPDWIPKGKIEQIVRSSCEHQYKPDDIESIFYENGGINGLLVLYYGTYSNKSLFAQIDALPIAVRAQLAKKCGMEKLNDYIPIWIKTQESARADVGVLSQPSRPLRLDRFASAKEERLPSPSNYSTKQGKRPRSPDETSATSSSSSTNELHSRVANRSDETPVTHLPSGPLPSIDDMLRGQQP